MTDVERKLDELKDLFTRRLLDDRQKRATIETLQQELDTARRGLAAEYLLPFVREIALVVDRLDQHEGDDPDFAGSVGAELVDVLGRHGVAEVATTGAFDAELHEAVDTGTDPSAPEGHVLEVRRRGFLHEPSGTLLRPAHVVVNVGNET